MTPHVYFAMLAGRNVLGPRVVVAYFDVSVNFSKDLFYQIPECYSITSALHIKD